MGVVGEVRTGRKSMGSVELLWKHKVGGLYSKLKGRRYISVYRISPKVYLNEVRTLEKLISTMQRRGFNVFNAPDGKYVVEYISKK